MVNCKIVGNVLEGGEDAKSAVGVTTSGDGAVVAITGMQGRDFVVYRCADDRTYQTQPGRVPEAFLAAHPDLVDKGREEAMDRMGAEPPNQFGGS